jgi:hypothetical protein
VRVTRNLRPNRQDAEAAARVQEQIQTFLLLTFPFTSLSVIVTALTYEIARTIANHLEDEHVDDVLAGVMATMKEQIRAHRAGQLPESDRRP